MQQTVATPTRTHTQAALSAPRARTYVVHTTTTAMEEQLRYPAPRVRHARTTLSWVAQAQTHPAGSAPQHVENQDTSSAAVSTLTSGPSVRFI